MLIAAYVLGGLVVAMAVASAIAYFILAVPAMRNAAPLSEADRQVCANIVNSGKGYPWVCSRAVRTNTCLCQPCGKVARAQGAK